MTANDILHVITRFIHISSVIMLLGGIVYARLILAPTLQALPEAVASETTTASQAHFRNPLFSLLALIVASGLYNFFTGTHHGRDYQIWFGIKMLLVAHFAATSILWATSNVGASEQRPKSNRRLLSLVISGLLIVAISAYLRSLSLRGL